MTKFLKFSIYTGANLYVHGYGNPDGTPIFYGDSPVYFGIRNQKTWYMFIKAITLPLSGTEKYH